MSAAEMPVSGAWAGLLIATGIYWVAYSLVLFLLMRVQGWRVGPMALLGSTALASALSQIPVVGHYVGTAVLVLCIWKASQSDLTDTVFSVVIAGALMLAFKIFALTALMGQLSPGWLKEVEEREEPAEVVQVEATRSWSLGGKEPLLYLKGITLSTNGHMVLVGSGGSNHSFTNGEVKRIPVTGGRLVVECELIRSNEVIMRVDYRDQQFRVPLVPEEGLEVAPDTGVDSGGE